MRRKSHRFSRKRASKVICAFLLAFQVVFLNAVLPGHTRGAITLTGKSSVESLRDLGCPFCGHSSDQKKSPTRQDQSDCAICHLAMRITSEPPFDFSLTDLGLLHVALPPIARIPVVAAVVSLPLCRSPPAVSF